MKLHDTTVSGTSHFSPNILNGGTRHARALVRFAFVLLACFAAVFGARSAAPARESNRFLFVIDTSASMKPLDKALRETVFDLVYSGIRGYVTNGDTYGIWLVNDQTDTSFAMESWKQRYNVELAARATEHVRKHGFNGQASLQAAFGEALRIAKRVGDLTIVLVSNGETPIAGTPFDDAINNRFRELAPEMKRVKATLNTVFVTRDGELVAWAANTSEFLINVPYVPPKPKPAIPEAVAQKTNLPVLPSSNSIAKAAPAPVTPIKIEAPKPRFTPIIITKETVAQEKREFQAMAMIGTTNEPAAAVTRSNSVVAQISATETNAGATAVTSALDSNPIASAVSAFLLRSNAVATSTATNRVVTNTVAAVPTAAETSAAVATPIAKARAVKAAAEKQPPESPIHPALWAVMGAGAALSCVLVLVIVARSRRHEPSLISQAAAQERIRVS